MIRPIAYNEHKFAVPESNVGTVARLLESLAGGTDPYPDGRVTTIYFDTPDLRLLAQCDDGSLRKTKLRIRRYDDGDRAHVQAKERFLHGVAKLSAAVPHRPDHASVWPRDTGPGRDGERIRALASLHPGIRPVVSIVYRRRRYRFLDGRITFDTEIAAEAHAGLRDARSGRARSHSAILEVKCGATAAVLPPGLRGLVRHQSSSKYAAMTWRLLGGSGEGSAAR